MRALTALLGDASRAFAWGAGAAVLALALWTWRSADAPADLILRAGDLFGATFLVLYAILVFVVLFALERMREVEARTFWSLLGDHAAAGIATLALSFTLLGVALGVGALDGQILSPATVGPLVSELTGHFSLAFMTTVLGLPSSALLRAAVALRAESLAHEDGRRAARRGGEERTPCDF